MRRAVLTSGIIGLMVKSSAPPTPLIFMLIDAKIQPPTVSLIAAFPRFEVHFHSST